ncbi:hypothetical protein SBOR_6344 [Sclerotinia borealis F-4128]|uniref:Cenp-O kinetochore centromere component n=1 Tax=Sclerotinia borealis (strain F-4128) TaxID=1432307 RepID=W9CEM0_SCLBF|nr:hypothetical protein SBOR_6344 [Sclerotinia borealis F-4128]
MDTTEEIGPEEAAGIELDDEIASLQEQIASLKDQRRLQTATILSSQVSKSTLSNLRKSSSKTTSSQSTPPIDSDPLIASSAAQTTHNLENLYRACASITSFHVQDPDPKAVDNGHVLGLRIDLSNAGKFVRPYYIMLNKPYSGSAALRIHRHTVPSCIPLASIAAKHLPVPKVTEGIVKEKRQDLTTFVRKLRREITGYHLRISSIKHLRKGFSLDEQLNRKGKEKVREIADISAADAEAKQVRIEWVDGRIGRCVVGMNGEVVKRLEFGSLLFTNILENEVALSIRQLLSQLLSPKVFCDSRFSRQTIRQATSVSTKKKTRAWSEILSALIANDFNEYYSSHITATYSSKAERTAPGTGWNPLHAAFHHNGRALHCEKALAVEADYLSRPQLFISFRISSWLIMPCRAISKQYCFNRSWEAPITSSLS